MICASATNFTRPDTRCRSCIRQFRALSFHHLPVHMYLLELHTSFLIPRERPSSRRWVSQTVMLAPPAREHLTTMTTLKDRRREHPHDARTTAEHSQRDTTANSLHNSDTCPRRVGSATAHGYSRDLPSVSPSSRGRDLVASGRGCVWTWVVQRMVSMSMLMPMPMWR